MDSRKLYAHAKTAGILYQAQLRHELTTRLGVAWQQVSNGYADIDDMRGVASDASRRTARPLDRGLHPGRVPGGHAGDAAGRGPTVRSAAAAAPRRERRRQRGS
ncbi:MAG: relaxase domain-containing protein [Nitriliruptoraceae bacterium]